MRRNATQCDHNITKSKYPVEKDRNYITNLVTRNALQLTYGDAEIQKKGEGQGQGQGEGQGEGEGPRLKRR